MKYTHSIFKQGQSPISKLVYTVVQVDLSFVLYVYMQYYQLYTVYSKFSEEEARAELLVSPKFSSE